MPIPFILAGIALAAAGYGVKKGIDASEKNDEAKRRSRRAKEKYDDAKSELDSKNDSTKQNFVELGQLKLSVLTNSLPLIDKVLTRCEFGGADLEKKNPDKFKKIQEELKEMQTLTSFANSLVQGSVAGVSTGVALTIGAYGSVGALATASTGTAIAGLSRCLRQQMQLLLGLVVELLLLVVVEWHSELLFLVESLLDHLSLLRVCIWIQKPKKI